MKFIFRALLVLFLIFCATQSDAAVSNWIRAEDGYTIIDTTYEPTLLEFDSEIYLVAEDGLYLQLYNQPCLGWKKVYTPASGLVFVPTADYLYAFSGMDLWFIHKDDFSSDNWKKVSMSVDPKYELCVPMTIFNGNLYASFSYHTGDPVPFDLSFDILMSANIGNTTMTWSKVVDKGFGDYQNHDLGYMGTFKGKLMAITTLTHDGVFGDTERYLDGIEVWQSPTGNLGSWAQVNQDGFGTEIVNQISGSTIRTNCNLGDAEEYNSYLYVGTKSHLGAEVWRYDGTGLTGWTNVTPFHLGVDPFFSSPSRVSDLSVYDGKLYLAEGFPTANLSVYDGSTWTILEAAPPFDTVNDGLAHLAVLPSRSTQVGATGDMIFLTTFIRNLHGGGYQLWAYPFLKQPLTCSQLKQATIEVDPVTATNELGPGQTHTVNATVDVGGVDISDLWINISYEIEHKYSQATALGFLPVDGKFGITFDAVQGPDGIWTDLIEACFHNSETSVCATADKIWVDTTAPVINLTSPQDGAEYILNEVHLAMFTVEDAVGVQNTVSTVPDGSPFKTDQTGYHSFNVTATDYAGNQTSKSVQYKILAKPIAEAGPNQTTLVGLAVHLDGSASYDPDGTIVEYLWDLGGPTCTGKTCVVVFTTPGLKAVTLTVKDNDDLTDSDTLTVNVLTPTQGTKDLVTAVEKAQLTQDIEDGLLDKLQAAINALNKGNEKAAKNILSAFINQVNSQRGKTLTDAQADALIAQAQDILDSINAT